MVDWNRYMADALVKLISNKETQKKEIFEGHKKIKLTPSEKSQDELEPIVYNEE